MVVNIISKSDWFQFQKSAEDKIQRIPKAHSRKRREFFQYHLSEALKKYQPKEKKHIEEQDTVIYDDPVYNSSSEDSQIKTGVIQEMSDKKMWFSDGTTARTINVMAVLK